MASQVSFVRENSIVRQIWGSSDTVLFIFAGAAAEFALNKAVDWLYFTGKLPSDPLGRLFSTVAYAHKIIFATETDALAAIDTIANIHKGIEQQRNAQIPEWAYRDVLYMLIDYSIRAFELLERDCTNQEKEDVYDVFFRMGKHMGISQLPDNYRDWLTDRNTHLEQDLVFSQYTPHLFAQYKKHLGAFRYGLVLHVQRELAPARVLELLQFKRYKILSGVIPLYKMTKQIKIGRFAKSFLLPNAYRAQILKLDLA